MSAAAAQEAQAEERRADLVERKAALRPLAFLPRQAAGLAAVVAAATELIAAVVAAAAQVKSLLHMHG